MPLHSLSSLLPSHALLYPTATTSPPRDRRLQPAATLAAITGRAHRWSRPSLVAPVILDPTSVCNNEGSLPPLQRSIPPTCAATKGSLPPLQRTVPCAAAISPFLPYETADAPYTVVGHTSFSCINNDTILSSPQSQQPASIAATISALLSLSAASSVVLAALSRCHIPLMPLLSSAPAAQAAVAVAVLFLCQPRCCLPRLCRQSCEQDRPGRASPAASPPLHRCHRRAPPLCLIVTGSDLRPTVPSCPNNALLLLPQPLLADYLIAALSSSPTAAPLAIFYSNSLKEKKKDETKVRKKRRRRASMPHLALLTFSHPARSFYPLPLLGSTDTFFLGSRPRLYQFSTLLSNDNLCSILSVAYAPCQTSSQSCLHPPSQPCLHDRRSQLLSDLHCG
ncbi:hypothetical protein BHM03_00017775 [Ensete ventricosum]|nr:hypothetical protein BHM03_00017775 [Ensete ventricosum]